MTTDDKAPSSVTPSGGVAGADTKTTPSSIVAGGSASGNAPVASPGDAKPGEAQCTSGRS